MNKNYEFFIVRAEGGLGAQIVAVTAYFFLKNIGCKVLMDLGYFEHPYREAEIGKPQVTHWEWKLNYYGIDKSNLDWINLARLRGYTQETKKDSAEGVAEICRRGYEHCSNIENKQGKKLFVVDNLKFNHLGTQSSHPVLKNHIKVNRAWHFCWSKFYLLKKLIFRQTQKNLLE